MFNLAGLSEDIETYIQTASASYSVPVPLIKAIIKIESDYRPSVYKQEPHVKDASWGLMQVLLSTAKWISGNNDLTASQLMDPSFNIYVGTKYLAYLMGRYSKLTDVMAAYNAGSPRLDASGKYVNQSYVDKASKWYATYATTEKVKATIVQATSGSSALPIGLVAIGILSAILLLRRR